MIQSEFTREEIIQDYWGCARKAIQQFDSKPYVVTKKGAITFAEANQRANAICAVLQEMRAGKSLGDLSGRGCGVGLFIKDHLAIIPAMLGVLKSGNYFVALDVNFPEATLQYMFANAGIKVVLTVGAYAERVRSMAGKDLAVLNLNEVDLDRELPDPVVNYSPANMVQIMFTSGSTGQPKGAIEDYRYLGRGAFLRIASHICEPGDRLLQLSTFTFSAPHVQVFTALIHGYTLCYYDIKEDGLAGLPQWIRQQGITVFSSTPTLFRSFVGILGPDEVFPSVHTFRFGAEKRFHHDLQAMKSHFPGVKRIRLGFSSTETQAVSSTIFPVDYDFGQTDLPSGRPHDDLRVYIWDEKDRPLPPGEEGEIVVYGDALARGYVNNPELTHAHFIPDPANPPWQFFKTGDLGKLLPDGQLVHLGRMDNMVKIKGVRIELDAIEDLMLSYPGIVQVASRVIEDPNGNKKLVCYFVHEKGIQVPVSDLRKHLAERLPKHLLPHFLVPVDEMPLTGGGKVARTRLPIPQLVRPELSNPYEPPLDELEKQLVAIWEEEIGITGIGVTDDFFDVGGDSLIGVLMFVRIEEVLGRNLPVSVLLSASTIRRLAEMIRKEDSGQKITTVLPINPDGDHSPLFFIPGKGGYPTRIRHLAKKIDPHTPVYALQDLMEEGRGRLPSIESAATLYLNEIRKIFPKGPYILVGESMGGKIALEMADQLLKGGEKAPVLVLLDTYNLVGPSPSQNQEKSKLPYYIRLITVLTKKHLSILLHSDWQGRLDYLRFYGETGGTTLKGFLSGRARPITKVAKPALPENERTMESANRQVARDYQVKPYPGRVILIKALRGPGAENPTNGWDRAQLGELVVYPLDCYHGSILFEPAVSQLAKIIQGTIEGIH